MMKIHSFVRASRMPCMPLYVIRAKVCPGALRQDESLNTNVVGVVEEEAKPLLLADEDLSRFLGFPRVVEVEGEKGEVPDNTGLRALDDRGGILSSFPFARTSQRQTSGRSSSTPGFAC